MTLFALIGWIISIVSYVAYTTYTYIKYKPDCISETYYKLKKPYIFTAWMLLIAVTVFPSWVEITGDDYQFISFLSVVSLVIVGFAPSYLKDNRVTHMCFTLFAVILSLIWSMIVTNHIIALIAFIITILLIVGKSKNIIFWVENLAFLNIYLSIIFK